MGPVIVDSSVWAKHLRRPSLMLRNLLRDRRVLTHPLVTAELMLGRLDDRWELLDAMRALPRAPVAEPDAVLALIETEFLYERKIGYVDANLLASARLRPGVMLWSEDVELIKLAEYFGVAAE
ncbi:type II toxin-antitoxin system VapC family toxin [Sphingomonas lenta]|uniref:VapC toxin family PIN domain ribonuclease n=1 Tax=Sphingomonas lenta TaxID=1141887 RepID=A0A2A2SDS7_9SPHN|nr:type II toxin-antitoxin system VapC family toxin [Sphingomonas lenta]PAX07342.1 VapC toxin family PIN domain ribonuclease [Sphingomonas lenta]